MFVSYLIPQALQRGVPSSAFLHMGVFLVQHDAQILSSDDREMKTSCSLLQLDKNDCCLFDSSGEGAVILQSNIVSL